MKFSLIPALFLLQMLGILYAARYALNRQGMKGYGWFLAITLMLALWGLISSWLALSGVYLSPGFLAVYPTLWLPFIPLVPVIAVLAISATARRALQVVIDTVPVGWLIGIHALRILALGTMIKAWRGEFSLSFALWVGVPDLLYGLSALWMLRLAAQNRLSDRGLLIWNLLGVLVILPGAPLIGQMGLPGIFHMIEETPSMITLYEFPMVLAPSLVVPVFVMMNLFTAIRLIERRRQPLAEGGR